MVVKGLATSGKNENHRGWLSASSQRAHTLDIVPETKYIARTLQRQGGAKTHEQSGCSWWLGGASLLLGFPEIFCPYFFERPSTSVTLDFFLLFVNLAEEAERWLIFLLSFLFFSSFSSSLRFCKHKHSALVPFLSLRDSEDMIRAPLLAFLRRSTTGNAFATQCAALHTSRVSQQQVNRPKFVQSAGLFHSLTHSDSSPTHSLANTLTHSLTHTHTLTYTHSLTH
jgi:hypothetical protein